MPGRPSVSGGGRMNYFFDLVQGFDLRIYHFLSRFAGNWFIDRTVAFQESNEVFKGGFIIAAYWWVWFRRGPDREKHRKTIIAIMFATVLAVVVTRILAAVLPFRLRPVYDPNLEHLWSIPIKTSFAQWNSFPSDTAAYLCALAFGFMVLVPRLKVPIVLYSVGWICFPRVFLGYHYASDVVAGTVIGVAVVWAVLKSEWLQSTVVLPIVAFADLKPHVFYAAAFLIDFEMAAIFWDIRALEHQLVHAIRMLGHHAPGTPSPGTPGDSLAAFAALLLAVAAAIVILLIRRHAHGHHKIVPRGR